jgi:hypothetical protein
VLVKNSRGTRDSKGYRLGQHPAHICEFHFNFFTPRIYVIVKNSLSQLLILNPVSICVNLTLFFCLSLYTSTIEFFDSRLIDFYIFVEIVCYVNPRLYWLIIILNFFKKNTNAFGLLQQSTTQELMFLRHVIKNISNLGVDIYVMVLNFILICFSSWTLRNEEKIAQKKKKRIFNQPHLNNKKMTILVDELVLKIGI